MVRFLVFVVLTVLLLVCGIAVAVAVFDLVEFVGVPVPWWIESLGHAAVLGVWAKRAEPAIGEQWRKMLRSSAAASSAA